MTKASWFLRPNWASPLKVTYEFKTDILHSRGDNEQRRAVRATPRKTIEIQATALNPQDIAFFHRFLASYQPVTLLVPEWPLVVRLVGNVLAGDIQFTIDRDVPNWLTVGVVIMLATPTDTFSAAVTLVVPSTRLIEVASSATADFPANTTRICPMRKCYFPETTKLSRAALPVADGQIVFEVEETSEDELTPADPFFVYETTEVFLETPDWSTPIDEELTWIREIVDAGFGPTKRYSPGPRQTRGHRATYWRRGSAQALSMLDFFLRMRGQQGEFLMPTWEQDIFPAFDIVAGDSAIREGGTLLADTWFRGWPYVVIMIETKAGVRYFRRTLSITAVTDGYGTGSVLTFDTPIGDDIAVSDILRVSWVPTWRFATDQLTIEWRTDEVGVLAMAFQTIGTIRGTGPAPPPPFLLRVVFIPAGTTLWPVPDELDPTRPVSVEVVASGQGGGASLRGAFVSGISGLGGAGGAYSAEVGLALTHGATISVAVPFGGAGSTTPGIYIGESGGDARFGIGLGAGGVDLVRAEGGHLDISANPIGGRASEGIGSIKFSGGNGGLSSAFGPLAGPGGGGAGGPHGDGQPGGNSVLGGGGSGGGAADGGSAGNDGPGAGRGGDGGAAHDLTAGGIGGVGTANGGFGLRGSGGGGGSGNAGITINGGDGGGGGNGEPIWIRTSDRISAGPGGGAGGSGGGSVAKKGGKGGKGGKYGGGGGAGGAGSDPTDPDGLGGDGGDAIIVVTYWAVG